MWNNTQGPYKQAYYLSKYLSTKVRNEVYSLGGAKLLKNKIKIPCLHHAVCIIDDLDENDENLKEYLVTMMWGITVIQFV